MMTDLHRRDVRGSARKRSGQKSMDSDLHPWAGQCSQQVDLQQLSGAQFLRANENVVKAAEEAVLPFHFRVSPALRSVRIEGDAVAVMIASRIFEQIASGPGSKSADSSPLTATISTVVANALRHDLGLFLKGLSKVLVPKSLRQVAFLQTLLAWEQQLVIALGPTGTGKTHVAIAAALNHLAEERVRHVVITRPHVVIEGETVTATMRQELDTDYQLDYFDDVLHDLVSHRELTELKKERKLEVIPLGRMRGRTFNNTFIIVDEAQNTTISKMRMVVTRIGRTSRMVVTGDPTHVELFGDEPSGLVHLLGLLEGTEIAKFHRFESNQIVRNSIVARLEELYARRHDGSQDLAVEDGFGGRSGGLLFTPPSGDPPITTDRRSIGTW